MTTPTGAALVSSLASRFGSPPPMIVEASGFGAGARDHAEIANVTQIVIGRYPSAESAQQQPSELLRLVSTNVDDVTGEVIAYTIELLLDNGALDAWATPIVMKKGRPAVTLSVLCRPSDTDIMRQTLISETGTFGVRTVTVERSATQREFSEISLDGGSVRLKRNPHRRKAEFDDARAVARATGRPVRDVIAEAEAEDRKGAT